MLVRSSAANMRYGGRTSSWLRGCFWNLATSQVHIFLWEMLFRRYRLTLPATIPQHLVYWIFSAISIAPTSETKYTHCYLFHLSVDCGRWSNQIIASPSLKSSKKLQWESLRLARTSAFYLALSMIVQSTKNGRLGFRDGIVVAQLRFCTIMPQGERNYPYLV